jgi:hypothetical protein
MPAGRRELAACSMAIAVMPLHVDSHSQPRKIATRGSRTASPPHTDGIVNLLNFGLSMDTWNLGRTTGSIFAAALRRLPWPCR